MLVVETIAKIRRMYHTDGKSIRVIARDLGIWKCNRISLFNGLQ
jgi:hypothetical protein